VVSEGEDDGRLSIIHTIGSTTFVMAVPILPQEVTEHLEAAIQLSNRQVHLRFLNEAEALITLNLPIAAVRITGVVLESILSGFREPGVAEEWRRLERWLDLHNAVAHTDAAAVTLGQAKEMVEDVRNSLMREIKVGSHPSTSQPPAEATRQIRGKYKFVPTSTADFIRRKAEELRLEHDEHGS
jgi:hypothetical protein